MTTLIWSFGRMVADTRLQTPIVADDKIISWQITDDCEKIFHPKNLTFDGNKVLAIGVAGMFYLMQFLQKVDLFSTGHDIKSDGFFNGINDAGIVSATAIVVTAKKTYTIVIEKSVVNFMAYNPFIPLAVGSGLPFVIGMFNTVAPELVISSAMEEDPGTGGKLLVWNYGTKKSKLINPVKKHLKEQCAISFFFRYIRAFTSAFSVAFTYRRQLKSL